MRRLLFLFIIIAFLFLGLFNKIVFAGGCMAGVYGQGTLDCTFDDKLEKLVCHSGGFCCQSDQNCPTTPNGGDGGGVDYCPEGYLKLCDVNYPACDRATGPPKSNGVQYFHYGCGDYGTWTATLWNASGRISTGCGLYGNWRDADDHCFAAKTNLLDFVPIN
jgi:hypothetical protein